MVKNSYLRKKSYRFFLIFFKFLMLFSIATNAIGQDVTNKKINILKKSLDQDRFSGATFNIILLAGITQKAAFHKLEGSYIAKATVQPNWEAGAEYQIALKRKYSFIVGVHATVGGRNTIFDAPVKEINPIGYQEPYILKNNDFDVGLALPLLIEKQWTFHKLNRIYIQTGVEFHYSLGYDNESYAENLQDVNGNNIKVFSTYLNANNQNKPWITYSIGSGVRHVLYNNNVLKIGIKADVSFTHFINGIYQINVPGYPLTTGIYRVRGSYIGIIASYGFTGINKKMVRAYENR